jgi:hypothetical protein
LEVTDSDKHSSLLRINYGCKKFYRTGALGVIFSLFSA